MPPTHSALALTPAGLALAGALGLVVGSFLNVVIHRLPRNESIVRPRSRCPGCRQTIAAWDNLPVLSYLLLRGRCRRCKTRISPRYPLVELLTGAAFLGIAAAHGASVMTVMWWIFAAGLIAAAGVDWDERWIPDEISLGGIVAGLALVPIAQWIDGAIYLDALRSSAAGALLGGGSLWLVGFLHARLADAMGRTFDHWPGEGAERPRFGSLDYWTWFPGLGFGDVKLMTAVGAFVGPVGAVQVIFLAALFGLAFGLILWFARRGLAAPFGFGPPIALAAVVAVIAPGLGAALF